MRKTALSLTTAVLALAALGAGSASATFAGRPGQIIYSGGLYVASLNPDNGNHRNVVNGGGPYTPQFLPGGKRFAYVNGNEGTIYVRSLRGSNVHDPGRAVIDFPFQTIRALTVGPRGEIVFTAPPRKIGRGNWHGPDFEIFSVRADGSGLRQLTHNHVYENDPALSPDGKTIAFVRRVHGRGQIFTMSASGKHLRRITRDRGRDRAPSFSPSGGRIAYFSRPRSRYYSQEIFTIAARGGHRVRLTTPYGTPSDPVYSPDGHKIAFVIEGTELWTMRPNGSHQRQVFAPAGFNGIQAPDWGAQPR